MPITTTTMTIATNNNKNNNKNNDNNNNNDKDNNNNTGVCKINGVVIVVNYCCSIGFSTINNNKNTAYFANTGMNNKQ